MSFHDLLDPFTGTRTSLRVGGGRVLDGAAARPGRRRRKRPSGSCRRSTTPTRIFRSSRFNSPRRTSYAIVHGGVAQMNVAMQWQEIHDADLSAVVADVAEIAFPKVTPILSVHSDLDSSGFGAWLAEHADEVHALLPSVCKLYSYSEHFWENLDSVFEAGLRPVIYYHDMAAVEGVVDRATGPVHFRHAISRELVEAMSQLAGATLQTSPHFLVPLDAAHRGDLFVLPPVAEDELRLSLAKVFLDEIDLLVSDHNTPPYGNPTGPGLQVEQDFLSSILASVDAYGWPLDRVWDKVTAAPARALRRRIGETFVIVDPKVRAEGSLSATSDA